VQSKVKKKDLNLHSKQLTSCLAKESLQVGGAVVVGVAARAGDWGAEGRELGQSPHGVGGVGGEGGQYKGSSEGGGSKGGGSEGGSSEGGSSGGTSGGPAAGGAAGGASKGTSSRGSHATVGGGDGHGGGGGNVMCSDSTARKNQFTDYKIDRQD
jgi:hypothetical protein